MGRKKKSEILDAGETPTEKPKYKFARGQVVKDKISGQKGKIYSHEKDGAYTIDLEGVEWVLWRGESDLS